MGKSVEFRGKEIKIGDVFHVSGVEYHVRGFLGSLPVGGRLTQTEQRAARKVVDAISPALNNTAQLQEAVDAELRTGVDRYPAYMNVVDGKLWHEVEKLGTPSEAKIGTEIRDGFHQLMTMGKTNFKDSEFEQIEKTDEGRLLIARCPFRGVARMLAGATYTVVHGKKQE